MKDFNLITDDGKWACHVYGTHFNVTNPDRTFDVPGELYAYRNVDGSFETDIAAGALRFEKCRGARQVANGLRRLGFNQKQIDQILTATLSAVRERQAAGCLS